MIITPLPPATYYSTVHVQCELCPNQYYRKYNLVLKSRRVRDSLTDVCPTCSRVIGASKRPQNSKTFLDAHRSSEAYYTGIANPPDTSGERNNMFGKQHTVETKHKMSVSRTGKTGANATAWRGGKLSLNRLVKAAIQRKWKWFSRVIQRDGKCTRCGATTALDAHHIIPVATILRMVLKENPLIPVEEQYDFLVNHEKIKDTNLTNGTTLCRSCHKIAHINWGSHEPAV